MSVMSIGFLLPSPDEAVIWRGPKKNGMIKQFLRDVDWGTLDYLVVDTPPGTSDEHLTLVQYLKDTVNCSAIIVTTPQVSFFLILFYSFFSLSSEKSTNFLKEVALSDVRKEINFCKKVGLEVLGVVENMSGFVCPKCHVSFLFMIVII